METFFLGVRGSAFKTEWQLMKHKLDDDEKVRDEYLDLSKQSGIMGC